MSREPVAVSPGDIARLRKPHPCGGYEWNVTRIGADIGLVCTTCGRRILLDRETFERRLQRLLPGAQDHRTEETKTTDAL